MYTLDSNAIIYYLGREPRAVETLESIFESAAPLYVSTVTVVELFSRTLNAEEKAGIEEVIGSLFVIPVDMDLARSAGEIRRLYRLKTPDSLIAATALHTRSALVTRNVRDFAHIPALALHNI